MPQPLKMRLAGFAVLLIVVSLACNTPFGLDLRGSEDRAREAGEVIAQLTPSPTPTVTPTPTNTATPTDTPVPTPTSTLVVKPTSTPTAVSGASGAAAPGGEVQIAPVGGVGATATPVSPPPAAPVVASTANVIVNGSFEDDPWSDSQGIAPGWNTFDNGDAHFGWYKDTWEKVVYDGERAQLIEIIADREKGDRYAGIYQTVDVVPNARYELTIHGLVRSDEGSGEASGFGYVLQYGIDFNGGTDWTVVPKWVDLPFPEHPREDPEATNVYNYGTFTTEVIPTGRKLTLYIRAWKKFAGPDEGNYDVDALSLRGAPPAPVQMPVSGDEKPAAGPPVAIVFFSLLSILILFSGAIIGLIRQRAGSQVNNPPSSQEEISINKT